MFAAYPPKLRKRLLAVRRGREKTHIRLQGIPEEQGYVLDNLAEFLFEV